MTKPQAMPIVSAANSERGRSSRESRLPTTFVVTDNDNFRELVQKLTGLSDELEGKNLHVSMPAKTPEKGSARAVAGIQNKATFKLRDRKQFHGKLKLGLAWESPDRDAHKIMLQGNGLSSNLISSPITPLGPDPFTLSSCYWSEYCYSPCSSASTLTSCNKSRSEEEEEEFSFQVSPTMRPPKSEPNLLPLFPLHSTTPVRDENQLNSPRL